MMFVLQLVRLLDSQQHNNTDMVQVCYVYFCNSLFVNLSFHVSLVASFILEKFNQCERLAGSNEDNFFEIQSMF